MSLDLFSSVAVSVCDDSGPVETGDSLQPRELLSDKGYPGPVRHDKSPVERSMPPPPPAVEPEENCEKTSLDHVQLLLCDTLKAPLPPTDQQ